MMNCRLFALVLFSVCLAGCGPARPKTVKVSGRILFAGEKPPKPGDISFAPLEAAPGFPLRAGMGRFDAEGNIKATSYVEGDGLVPGRYEMKVECWKTPPNEGFAGASYVPADFRAGILEVPADGSAPAPIALDVPKNW